MNNKYIHGYKNTEQFRLIKQAKFLEPYIHTILTFNPNDSLLEIGCGVGAQIKITLERHQVSKVTGIDISDRQIDKAKQFLAPEIEKGLVELYTTSGSTLPFEDNTFDGINIFFVLEHFHNPTAIISEGKRVLKPGGKFYCTEPFNSSLYIYPQNTRLMKYWNQMKSLQYKIGGDPDVGIKLYNYFVDTNMSIDKFIPIHIVLDKQIKNKDERHHFLNIWETLFLNGYETLISEGIVPFGTYEQISAEFDCLKNNPNTIFVCNAYQIHAKK